MSATPRRLGDPFITLGEANAGPPVTVAYDFQCFSSGIHLVPETDDAAATFCDPNGFKWKLTVDIKVSLGTGSVDEALTALGIGNVVPFEFAYATGPAAIDNPHWSGNVRIPAWTIVDAGINEVTEVNLEMDVIGDISRDDGSGMTVLTAVHSHEVAA